MRAFIGIGPGRCGTMSLARIVGACKNTEVTHEAYPSPWYKPGENLGKLVLKMRRSQHLVGEVSCNLLPHIEQLRGPIRDLKIICLHRPKDEVVRSFMGHTAKHSLRPTDRPQWKSKMLAHFRPDTPERLPIIDAATKEQSWGFYWEMAEEIMRIVKEPALHIHMKSLNDDFTVNNIFNFLDIPVCDRVLDTRRVWNSTRENLRV